MAAIEHDLAQNNTNMVVARAKLTALQKSMEEDPNRANVEQITRYTEDNKRLDIALAKTSTQIINPQEMVQLLEQILENQSGLKFISLKNKPATPGFVESHSEDAKPVDNVNSIYRHSVVLEVEGSYHSALAYMKKLESLPWRFFWQSVEIETRKYPNSLITLEVYTLGFREGLIGV
jgi:MSHA biogenesis protein MshJ